MLKKITYIVFRIALFLVFFEIISQTGGEISKTLKQREFLKAIQRKGTYRIICLGESITHGSEQNNYPLFLEKELNSLVPSVNFQVINLAVPGQDSERIVESTPQYIEKFDPDAVMVMMGVFDSQLETTETGFQLVNRLQRMDTAGMLWAFWKKIIAAFDQLIPVWDNKEKNSEIIGQESASKNNSLSSFQKFIYAQGRMAYFREDYAKAEGLLRSISNLVDENTDIFAEYVKILGLAIWNQKKFGEFIEMADQLPYYHWPVDAIDKLCISEPVTYEKTIRFLTEKARVHPQDVIWYELLVSCYELGGNQEMKERLQKQAQAIESSVYSKKAIENHLELIEIIGSRPMVFIVAGYPLQDLSLIRFLIKSRTDSDKVMFIQNRKVYTEALDNKSYGDIFTDRAAGDFGHLTTYGNQLIARNMAQEIAKKIFNQTNPQ